MIRVTNLSAAPEHSKRLREWFTTEWGKEGSLVSDPAPTPAMLVAVDGGSLLGGLAFTSYKSPESEQTGLWVNALYVDPQHRRKGIASQLVRQAVAEAQRQREAQLYALTDIPDLYEKLGWHRIKSDVAGTVVGISIAK